MELILTAKAPEITSNFAELKTWLQENLKKYQIEVTEENLSEAKKMATELNKLSTVINKTKSEKIREISAPIDVLKAAASEVIDMLQEGREKLLEQIKVFEDKTRIKVKELIGEEFAGRMNELNIKPEFRNINPDDFVQLSFITKTGSLTKAAKEAVAAKVGELKMLQDKVDMRLLQLENASLKAGLKSPLRRDHVEPFLMAPDDQYEIQLSRIIGIEVSRQAETETKFKVEQNQRPMRYFACAVCRHVICDHELPAKCPRCPSQAVQEYPSLTEARMATPTQPAPIAPPPLPKPPVPVYPPVVPAPQWNQERLHQMRQHLGDETFFQMFKIIYLPISERAIREATALHPDLVPAVEWAKGTD